jgi:hypothetical protein
MVTFTHLQRSFTASASEPEVRELLPDVPDGEPGLVPAASTDADLKVWFTVPKYSNPNLEEEKVELFVDNEPDPIATRYWTIPIVDTDRYVEIPKSWLRNNDGQHRIYYKITIFNGEPELSLDLIMTLDTAPPILATDSKLIFPSDVFPPPQKKLTAHYLEQHNDEVKAELPAYTTPRPWDRITWYWGETPGNADKCEVIDLDDKNFADPIVVTIKGLFIRESGDGMRYVWYKVADRAGNESRDSAVVGLDVAATPIPRNLPPIKVLGANGNPSSGSLNASSAINGATVTIPPDAVIYEGEPVFVQWAESGSAGEYRTDTPIAPDSRDYKIPADKVAHHIGKILPVRYEVVVASGGDPLKSQP